jgi:hypothetical protein
MLSSFQEVAKAMAKCATTVNDFVAHAPPNFGLNLPAAAAPVAVKAPRKNAAAIDNPAAVAAAVPTFSVVDPSAPAGKKPRATRKTKEKKVKDPNAPKRPPSAYLLFQNDVRDEMRESMKDVPYKEVIAAIGARWKTLTAEEKKVGRLRARLMGRNMRERTSWPIMNTSSRMRITTTARGKRLMRL